jgi:hypothetical protein
MLEINEQHVYYNEALELVKKSGVLYSAKEMGLIGDAVGCHRGVGGVIIMLLSLEDLKFYLENVSGGYGDGEL